MWVYYLSDRSIAVVVIASNMELLTAISLLVYLSVFISKPVQGSIHVPGDFKLIGLFEIYEPNFGICGSEIKVTSVMTAEAVKWYLRQLDRHGQVPLNIGMYSSLVYLY